MKLTDEQKALLAWKMGPGDANKFLRGENPVPRKGGKASADGFDVKPMSAKFGRLVLNIHITEANMEVLRQGHVPQVQEDHWLILTDETCIRIYRSWTGACMFEANYRKETNGEGYVIEDVKVNLDREEMDYVFGPDASCQLFICLIRAEFASQWEDVDEGIWMYWDQFIECIEKQ